MPIVYSNSSLPYRLFVVDRIIEEQKIDVDTVSGATNPSTVIKKVVENALTG